MDDHKIANDCALRPQARPGPESLERQCEYGKAAAIMVKILEIARLRRPENSPHAEVALELIPALLEEYLKLCGIAEFAPTEVGGPHLPYTKMMALFYAIYSIYERRPMAAAHPPLASTMSSGAGAVAMRRVAAMIAERSFDAREFRALRAGEPEEGVIEMALISSGRTTGEWPGCLNPLKRSAKEDTGAELGGAVGAGGGMEYREV